MPNVSTLARSVKALKVTYIKCLISAEFSVQKNKTPQKNKSIICKKKKCKQLKRVILTYIFYLCQRVDNFG